MHFVCTVSNLGAGLCTHRGTALSQRYSQLLPWASQQQERGLRQRGRRKMQHLLPWPCYHRQQETLSKENIFLRCLWKDWVTFSSLLMSIIKTLSSGPGMGRHLSSYSPCFGESQWRAGHSLFQRGAHSKLTPNQHPQHFTLSRIQFRMEDTKAGRTLGVKL